MTPLIISIETSTKVCSVALHKGDTLLASSQILIEKSHSKFITVLIENLFSYSGEKMIDLSAVAVSKGPGSYTGLRIGVSTAKGLCYALEKPLIAISTLESMAYEANRFNHTRALLCPMIDARRMEVYCALYDHELKCKEEVNAKIIDENSFQELLSAQPVLFFGDGAQKCTKFLGQYKNAIFFNDMLPSAINIGAMALKAYEEKRFEDVAYFEPFYLKDFVRFGA
ncbi:MAG TPA: tRNA (adenosine(37)-N6)-threonylcarbamoyltransferase complex dimerization subunit type 1 TsaB [Cytophagaceae bacterium]|jgi:tRNA threonylcarbamoyladenosine biosynthesis protein TsaB|nr:tRNA (adenosine(37)-N6)-threonylcarbamoyltransferase complex dimerization subunit type 1 TsaB [Cytophagaceae bacterium]